jgi:hypothetical protein
VLESVTFSTATTPAPIEAEFIPEVRQVMVPEPELQFNTLPAAVSAAPAEALTDDISLAGYDTVHWTPVGALPVVFNERFKEIEPPLTADPEARLKDAL